MADQPFRTKVKEHHTQSQSDSRPSLQSKKGQESSDEGGGVSTKQALIYFAIVLGCFVVIYPRMVHPMVKYALGFGEPATSENRKPDLPPQVRNHGKPIPGGHGMRPPPVARGENMNTDASKSGSSGGIMAMVLPLYAGGIFIYLIYTGSKAYKSSGTAKSKKDPQGEVYSLITDRLANLDLGKILSGEDSDGATEINKLAEYLRKKHDREGRNTNWVHDEDDEYVEGVEIIEGSDPSSSSPSSAKLSSKSHAKESARSGVNHEDGTDELLRKCENHEHLTEEEMIRLQKRLLEVEGRMNKLMSAIQTVQTHSPNAMEEAVADDPAAGEQSAAKDDESISDNDNNISQVYVSEESVAYQHVASNDSGNELSTDDEELNTSGEDEYIDRLDVEDIYGELDSSNEEPSGGLLDMEMGEVRKRTFPTNFDC